MIEPFKFERLVPRRGRSDQEDRDEAMDRSGYLGDLNKEVYERVADAMDDAVQVVDRVLKHLWTDKNKPRVPLAAVTLKEKCRLIHQVVLSHESNDCSLARFMGSLELIEHFDGQRSALLMAEWREPGSVTYPELLDLADYLVASAMHLEASMADRHDDYEPVL